MASKGFHSPAINPFQVPQSNPLQRGTGLLDSYYLFNYYNIDFNPRYWRSAADRALQYNDLTYLDVMYSWCVTSSPFLVGLIEKRVLPIHKRKFAIQRDDGSIWEELTESLYRTSWWRELISSIVLSQFYGVKVSGVDRKNDRIIDYALRNIDPANKALRQLTYQYFNVADIDAYDNLFYFQPKQDQDNKLGLLLPITRMMISIIESYNDWDLLGKMYSYPKVAIVYEADNYDAKEAAEQLAKTWNPGQIPLIPKTFDGVSNKDRYWIEIQPVNTQSYPQAYETFNQLIARLFSEIMQLVLGGTLLGSTEKNTNSEQLADIHLSLYQDKLDADARLVETQLNSGRNMLKLSRLLDIPELEFCRVVEMPITDLSLREFKVISDQATKQGVRLSNSFFKKAGLEESDFDNSIIGNSWTPVKEKEEQVKRKSLLQRAGLKRSDKQPEKSS